MRSKTGPSARHDRMRKVSGDVTACDGGGGGARAALAGAGVVTC
jgi:hypothetical protein